MTLGDKTLTQCKNKLFSLKMQKRNYNLPPYQTPQFSSPDQSHIHKTQGNSVHREYYIQDGGAHMVAPNN